MLINVSVAGYFYLKIFGFLDIGNKNFISLWELFQAFMMNVFYSFSIVIICV
ncbi:hypothetical protein BACPLE_03617 [Phocaeicola plebeius DSM 17135]|uniref:Uncharacterized protein n=1 Tax=Phocaeicola plebeius (strain DSM 17135 / JCM 12973 / CCUG 54634 / M2) TaxID=484018 RepID=B5D3M3_PHOPM|nr:hypothetical protein BACPLE_03617 [Phocaeicola plebeius DSM 17135]